MKGCRAVALMITSRVMTASSLSYCFVSVASAILCEVWVISPSVLAVMREKRLKRAKVRMGKCMIAFVWLFTSWRRLLWIGWSGEVVVGDLLSTFWGELMVYLYTFVHRILAAQLHTNSRMGQDFRHVTRESRFAHVLSYGCTRCGLGRATGPLRLSALRQALPAGGHDLRDINIARYEALCLPMPSIRSRDRGRINSFLASQSPM